MRVEQLLAHVAGAARDALVRLLVGVHEAVRVAVVARVERLAADLGADTHTYIYSRLVPMRVGRKD